MSKSRDAFRTISEVADWLDTPAHVLRFWESKFPQIKPVKRAGGRRYYRPEDMALLGGIKTLLHEDGLTIKGAQKLLREKGIRYVSSLGPSPMDAEDGDMEPIEGQISASAEAAPPAETPGSADPAPEAPEDKALPAFLRRAPAMGTPLSRSPAAGADAAAAPEESATEATTGDRAEDAPTVTPPQDSETDAAAPEGPAPDEPRDGAPDAVAAEPPSAEAPAASDPPATPPSAIPETAELIAALAPADAQAPKEPRVIHETHDPGAEWQPELPFGSLRPAPRAAKRRARATVAPVPARPEAAPQTGLLSLLAGAERLAADPARLAAALARLEALRDRSGP